MNLIVEFSNIDVATWEMQHTGELNIKRRVVAIPLTPEQVAMIEPRELGECTNYGVTSMLREDRRIICVQEEGL